MAIDDLDTGTRPDDLGGKESGASVEFSITDFLAFWRRWKRRGEPKQAAPPMSWIQQKEETNRRRADEEIAKACGETENQRKLREREGA